MQFDLTEHLLYFFILKLLFILNVSWMVKNVLKCNSVSFPQLCITCKINKNFLCSIIYIVNIDNKKTQTEDRL